MRSVSRRGARYWFDDGGRFALACVRIGVAIAVLLTLRNIAELPEPLAAPNGVYRPVGIWMLYGSSPPSEALVQALWAVAWVATFAMLVGLSSRIAVVASVVASVALASLIFSAKSASWSHQHNVVFVAQLALVGGRVGDTLSLDAVIRRLRGVPPLDVPRGYQWSLRLCQLAVALMFVSAAFFKLAQGQFTLRWALSDNLRHQLMVTFDLAGKPRPAVAEWLLESVWRYRLAALMNFGSQLGPLLAVVFVRRPWIRALGGALFAVEVLALAVVVDLWDLRWLPLVAVFIDWDRLFRRPAPPEAPAAWRPPRAAWWYVLAFVTYDVVVSFVPRLDARLNTYPFSSYPMYSTIRARAPYTEHLSYGVPGDRYHTLGTAPQSLIDYALDHRYRGRYTPRDADALEGQLRMILARSRTQYTDWQWPTLRHSLSLFVAPPYPAPARFEETSIATTGELTADGTFRTLLGHWRGTQLELDPRGLVLADAITFDLYVDDVAEPRRLTATRTGPTTWDLGEAAPPVSFLVATLDGTAWLAAWRRDWRWGGM